MVVRVIGGRCARPFWAHGLLRGIPPLSPTGDCCSTQPHSSSHKFGKEATLMFDRRWAKYFISICLEYIWRRVYNTGFFMSRSHPSWKLVNIDGGLDGNMSAARRIFARHLRRSLTSTVVVVTVMSFGNRFLNKFKHVYNIVFGSNTSRDSVLESHISSSSHSDQHVVDADFRLSRNNRASAGDVILSRMALSSNDRAICNVSPAKKKSKIGKLINQ